MKKLAFSVLFIAANVFGADGYARQPLDPIGKDHIPIGIANTLDSLKTFVEAEGCFSPGIGSYGVYYWIYDHKKRVLAAPTIDKVPCRRGLLGDRYLIPWSQWTAGAISVRSEVCQVVRKLDGKDVHLVGSRAIVTNNGDAARKISVYAALRSIGPAGFEVKKLSVSHDNRALLADGHTAIVGAAAVSSAGVMSTDTIGQLAVKGDMPKDKTAASKTGDCSGALRFDLTILPGKSETVELVCPVLPGRRAVRHKWTPRRSNYIDAAVPQSDADGIDVPDAGLDYYSKIDVGDLFAEAIAYWKGFYGKMAVRLPDKRWNDGYCVMLAHAAICMNEGAADVAVLNYPVYNRDGMYIANMMQKSGRAELSEAVIDYFLAHPFNGRPFPEADNPGQILWSIGQHWKFTGDKEWLRRIYPSAVKIAEMIRYYRTMKGPHWISMTSLEFGESLPKASRRKLQPGRCDGNHPEYTEAFDLAGVRIVADLCRVLDKNSEARKWDALAGELAKSYDRFSGNLAKGYGSYSVLWPCRLYPLNKGKAHEQFRRIGKQKIVHWRYFAPATAHQGLLAGNRQAGYGTIDVHLDHKHMRQWFAFDEGGSSGSGGWQHLRTTWRHSKTAPDANKACAMPHGWAIAEIWLLMRDSLLFEDGNRLVLFGGVVHKWFTDPKGFELTAMPTHFGDLSLSWRPTAGGAVLKLTGKASPPGGFVLRLPEPLAGKVVAEGKTLTASAGDYVISKRATEVRITFAAARK